MLGRAVKPAAVLTALLSVLPVVSSAQQAVWQRQIDEARRAAQAGEVTALAVRPSSNLGSTWPPGIYVFYNSPRPFCYTYIIPGDWYPMDRGGGTFRSKDGRGIAAVTFWPPRTLRGIEGATPIEKARNAAVRSAEKGFGQSLVGVELVQFPSTRPGTWRLSAGPITLRDGRSMPFPVDVIVDLDSDTFAEITVTGTADDEGLARRIIETLRTTVDAQCYWTDLERLYKAISGEP